MRLLAKLAVIAGSAAVMALPMAGTAFAATGTALLPVCSQINKLQPPDCTYDSQGGGLGGGFGGQQGGQNQGNNQDNKGPKCDPSPTRLGGGPDLRRDFTPVDCLPLPKPPVVIFPRDPKPPVCHDVTSWTPYQGVGDAVHLTEVRRTTKDCAPQDNNWTYDPQHKDWYDPTAGGWYAPVTGWTGGYQNDKGFWCYPKHQIVPLTSWNDHKGSPQGNCGCNNGGHGNTVRGCTPENVIFETPTYGDWLLYVGGPFLHNGEVLTYDGQTWTVEQWEMSTGSQGPGQYFVLRGGNGHNLESAGTSAHHASILTEVTHTVCNTVR